MDKMFIDIDFDNIKIKSQILIIGNVEKNLLKKLVDEYKCFLYGIGDKNLDNNYFNEYIKTDLNCLKISNYQNIVDKKFDYIILIDKLIFDLHNTAKISRLGKYLKMSGKLIIGYYKYSSTINYLDDEKKFLKAICLTTKNENNYNQDYVYDLEIINKKADFNNTNQEYENIMISYTLCFIKMNKNAILNNLNVLLNNISKTDNYRNEYSNLLIEYRNLKNNLNYIYSLYNKMLYSRSWKKTKVFRNIKNKYHDLKYKLTVKNDYKKNVLVFIHSWVNIYNLDLTNIGGTTLHLLDLLKNNDGMINYYIITIINGHYFLIKIEDDLHQKIYDIGISVKVGNYDAYDYDFYYRVKNIIKILDIDIIHIHHIAGFPCDLEYLIKDVPSVITIHDYFTICSKYFLLDNNNNYCQNKNANKCARCINVNVNSIKIRENAIFNLLKNVNRIIFPDDSVLNEFRKYYKINDYCVIPHGINTNSFTHFKYRKGTLCTKKNIAFIGFISNHKGLSYMSDLIKNNKNQNIVYHLFGQTMNPNEFTNCSNYVDHGIYNKKDLPKLLNDYKIDLVLLLSICPETFSYVLSEVKFAKIPCLAFDIGAIGNRIKKDKIGWTIPYNSSYKKIEEKISKIFNDGSYSKVMNNLKNYQCISDKQMASEVYKIYNDLYIKRLKDYYKIRKELKTFYLMYEI